MADNTYASPASGTPTDEQLSPRVLRRGVALAIGAAWNIPLALIAYFGLTFSISDRTMNLLAAAWASTIPVGALLAAYVKLVQRVLFARGFEVAPIRPRLLLFAILWALVCSFWLCSALVGG